MKKSINHYSLSFTLLFVGQLCFAQQDVLFSQFANTKNHFNPATSGLNYKIQTCAMNRDQWSGVNGAPKSQFVNYSMKLDKFNSGIGINYLHDEIGFSESNTFKLNYAYQIEFEKDRLLSFGLAAGLMNYKTEAFWIPPTTTPDPSLPQDINDTKFTSDFGIAFSTKKLNVGISSTHLTEERFSSSNMTYQSRRHFYAFADYTFGNEERFQFRPELLIVTDLVKLSPQLNIVSTYKGKYTLGIGYRSSDALIFMAAWDVQKKFRIGYSFDQTINKLSNISRGSHEVVLGFYLK